MLTIRSLLDRQADRHAHLTALIDDATGDSWTVADLREGAVSGAAALTDAGIAPGDRVGVLSHNHPSMVLTYLAVARIGAVLVPVNARLTASEIRFILDDAGCTALVAQADLAATAREVADRIGIHPSRRWVIDGASDGFVELDPHLSGAIGAASSVDLDLEGGVEPGPLPDDVLYLMYTSGTTGRPKGAVHTHATTLAAAQDALLAMDYRPGDRYLNVMPLFHVASLAMVNICLIRRCTMVLGRAFDPTGTWERIAERRIDAMMAVPAMLQAMAATHRADLDLDRLRVLSTGAAPVPLPLLETFAGLGIDIVQAYGLTEAGGAVSVLDGVDAAEHLGSAGKAILGIDLRLVGLDGEVVPDGEPGEIVIRGPAVTTGYWNMPEETAAAIDDEGWFHTGDVAVRDRDGYLTIIDRARDLVISGGENVYPAEIESVLTGHPAVLEVAVIGQPSERWGEALCAVVVADGELDPEELIIWARARLAGFKVPQTVEIVTELPRNASGKILKPDLRDRFPGPAPR